MTTLVITPIWAKDATVCQADGPKHYGMNENGELCGFYSNDSQQCCRADDEVFPIPDCVGKCVVETKETHCALY